MVDLNNYKGIYFDDDNEKYQCPRTGAHFKFEDLCQRMERIRIKRGDPKIEFDAYGNKICVKNVALPTKGANVAQIDSHQLAAGETEDHVQPCDKNGQRKSAVPRTDNKEYESAQSLGFQDGSLMQSIGVQQTSTN